MDKEKGLQDIIGEFKTDSKIKESEPNNKMFGLESDELLNETDMDEMAKEFAGLIPILNRKLFRPLKQEAKSYMSPQLIHILGILENNERLTMTEIAREMCICKQQVTPLIDKLIENGFANREHDESDRRTVRICLSRVGREYLNNFRQTISCKIKSKIKGLDPEDLWLLRNALKDLLRIIQKVPNIP